MRSAMPGVGNEAVRGATGRDWEQWHAWLDGQEARELDHKGRVALLADLGLSGWWCQTVAVAYERARGLRQVGQAQGGFQVGVHRRFPGSSPEAWRALTSAAGRRIWLRETPPLKEGEAFTLADGTRCEVRVLVPQERVRMRFHPPGWERPSTLQVAVLERPSGAALLFHQENMPDDRAREAMRERWKAALTALTCD